jgi:hypothetical protein
MVSDITILEIGHHYGKTTIQGCRVSVKRGKMPVLEGEPGVEDLCTF